MANPNRYDYDPGIYDYDSENDILTDMITGKKYEGNGDDFNEEAHYGD